LAPTLAFAIRSVLNVVCAIREFASDKDWSRVCDDRITKV
jgi:hypothetical protein